MYRLLFASAQLHVFWKSLICIRPLDRLKYCAVALLGVGSVMNFVYLAWPMRVLDTVTH